MVIAVWLAAARIEPRGLQMAVVAQADPDLLIGRRQAERPNAIARLPVAQQLTIRQAVAEAPAVPLAANAGLRVVDIYEEGRMTRDQRTGSTRKAGAEIPG